MNVKVHVFAVFLITCIALLIVTNAFVEKNMTTEQWHKMMSNRKCNITVNKTIEAVYVSECCEELHGIKIINPENRTEYAQYNLSIENWKEIHACRRNKSGKDVESEDGGWTKEKAVEMINDNLKFDNEQTKKELLDVYEVCDTENSENETAIKECGRNGFRKVCYPKQ